MKDHLGNTRMTRTDANNNGIFDNYTAEVLQADDYYPFGLRITRKLSASENRYTYNGKEHENDFNLNWYHYGARFYDPAVGRWWAVDPVLQYNSQYSYVGNSPIFFNDVDGYVGFSFFLGAEATFGGGKMVGRAIVIEFGTLSDPKFQVGTFIVTGETGGVNFSYTAGIAFSKDTEKLTDWEGYAGGITAEAWEGWFAEFWKDGKNEGYTQKGAVGISISTGGGFSGYDSFSMLSEGTDYVKMLQNLISDATYKALPDNIRQYYGHTPYYQNDKIQSQYKPHVEIGEIKYDGLYE